MKAHVAIVSDQLLPLLIPALMEHPERVYLAVSVAMADKGLDRRLARLLQDHGIAVVIWPDAPDAGLDRIHDFALTRAGEVEQAFAPDAVTFNATGGTKLMTLGFVEVMRHVAERIIYTDTGHGRIEVIVGGSTAPFLPIAGVIDVPLSLAASGATYRGALSDDAAWRARAGKRLGVAKVLARAAPRSGDFIGAINALANKALDERHQEIANPRQSFDRPPWGRWETLVARARDAGLIEWNGGAEIAFADAESARFLCGGWLEEHAWHVAREAGLDDCRASVEATWDGSHGVRNEFDVLAAHRGRMLVIESKTLRHGREETGDAAILYKLDSLADKLSSLFATRLLLSARTPTENMRRRAARHGITVFGPGELDRLKTHVARWRDGAEA